jgi:ubiquinone/menaquinone biosynthesis C-methylase UbiE
MTYTAFETTKPDPAAYLDRLAELDPGQSYKRRMLELLGVRPGHTVVDLGCGPGTDLLSLAAALGGSGAVIGFDRDEAMLARARQRVAGVATVGVRRGDIASLPLCDAGIDRARTDRVLQHVDDPARVLAEARRVLRPGGRLVMAEPDWDTLAVDHPDVRLSRAYTRFVAEEVVRNGAIGRELPRLAAGAGFSVTAVRPVTPVFRDLADADKVFGFERVTRRAVAAGFFTAAEAREWLDQLARGPFLATSTLHLVVADVPA